MCREEFQRRCRATGLEARGLGRNPFEGVPQWTRAETEVRYGQTLQAVAQIAEMKSTKATNDGRKRTFEEYQKFLAQNPFGVSVETASPEDVAAFIHSDWIPNHSRNCRTVLPQTEQPVASASAVRGVVKDLFKSYRLLQYEGVSNPARSELVKSYRDGYGNMLHHSGVKVNWAKVFNEAKLNSLVAYLTMRLGATEGMERCVLAMHRAAVLYLWETLARGKECGKVRHDQIDADEGTVLVGPRRSAKSRPLGSSWPFPVKGSGCRCWNQRGSW
jgi:hypothetical protein